MTASTPYLIGDATVASGTTTVITPATPTAAGDTIVIVATAASSGLTVTGITDSAGNSYSQQASNTSQNPAFVWVSNGVTVALTVSSTITVTWSSTTGAKLAAAVGCGGLAGIDQNPATTSAASGTAASITSGTLAMHPEVCIAMECNRFAGGGGGTWTAPFTALLAPTIAATGSQWTTVASQYVTSTSPVTAAFTLQASAGWSMALLTFKTSIPVVTTSSLPGGTVSVTYSQPLMVSGGYGGYSWTLTSGFLPPGLSLSSGGLISGSPTAAGTYTFTVQVTDGNGNTGSQPLSITIGGLQPFPTGPLGEKTELYLGGVWTDITGRAKQSGTPLAVTPITGGRQNQTTSATPMSATPRWNNRDAALDPDNPTGPYYGQLGQNTPCRISIGRPDSTVSYRAEDDAASDASTPGLNITTGIDVRIDFEPSGYYQMTLASQSGNWAFLLESDGTPEWVWTDSGGTTHTVNAGVAIPSTNLGRIMLRVSHNTTTGVVSFFTAPTMVGTQTLLASVTTTIASLKFTPGTALFCGGPPMSSNSTIAVTGRIFELQVYNGIGGAGGTLAADPVFTAQTAGATSFADAQSNTWTLNGSATINGRSYRAHLECASLPQEWDPAGRDIWVPVTLSGPLRRLQAGSPQIQSAMRRAIVAAISAGTLGVAAYWPCEDPQGSSVLASAYPGGLPMQFGVPPTFLGTTGSATADTQFPCSAQLPQVQSSIWTGSVNTLVQWNANVTRLLLYETAGSVPNGTVLARVYTTGTANTIDLYYGTGGGLGLRARDGNSTLLGDTGVQFSVDGQPVRVSIDLLPNGSNATLQIQVIFPGSGSSTFSIALTSVTVETVTGVSVNPTGAALGSTEIGHISVQGTWDSLSDLSQPLAAWAGEAAGMRFQRVCTENGIRGRVYGFPQLSQPMGPQQIDTLPNVLQSCEDADRGIIYEPRECLGLGYRTSKSMTNQSPQVTFDYSLGQVSPPLTPLRDDLTLRNDVILTRNNGSTAQSQITTGMLAVQTAGDYQQSPTVYVQSDAQLASIAGWMTHVGTAPGKRYPSVTVDLASHDTALQALQQAIADLRDGDLIRIINTPRPLLPPGNISQLVWGWAELIGDRAWAFTWNTVPESPYEVAVAGTGASDSARADTAGSQLHTGVNATANSLLIDTLSGPLWTTNAPDFPFAVLMGGELMTVTNITGSSSPQTFTVTRSANGVVKAQTANTPVSVYQTPIAALM